MSPVDFSRVAPLYQFLESVCFGRALQQRRCAFLRDVENSKNVLILGDGDGRFTVEYLHLNPTANVDFVDISAGMVRLAEQRVQGITSALGIVRFLIEDARLLEFHGPYDLVVSHFFLDCFSTGELQALLPRIAEATSSNAIWLVSDFALPEIGPWRMACQILIRLMYLFFRFAANLDRNGLPDYATTLKLCGFYRCRLQFAWAGFLVSELWRKQPRHGSPEQ